MNKPFKQAMTVILIIVNMLPLAAEGRTQGSAVGLLIEAAKYLEQSQEEMNCSTSGARHWAEKAQSTLRSFRSGSATDEATVAILRARISISTARIEERHEALKSAAKEISKFMDSHLIGSALRVLDRVERETPTCDARFKNWRSEASEQYAAASQLVREGDQMLGPGPRQALKLYESAGRMNREQPELSAKLLRAREAVRASGGGGHPVAKAVVWTVVIGAAVAGAAYADQYQKRKAKTATPVRRP